MSPVDLRAVSFDVLAVLGFVVIGRMQHDGGDAFALDELLRTLWPFLGGLMIAIVVMTVASARYAGVLTGIPIALVTAWCGLALRYASGQGIAVAFAIVATMILAVFMIGWRWFALGVGRG